MRIGRLDAVPALDRPDLLAPVVAACDGYLEEATQTLGDLIKK